MKPSVLDYARSKPRRKRWYWMAAFLIALTVLAAINNFTLRVWWFRTSMMYGQYRSRIHQKPPNESIAAPPSFASYFAGPDEKLIFLHEMTSPSGIKCLVALTGNLLEFATSAPDTGQFELRGDYYSYKPGTWREPHPEFWHGSGFSLPLGIGRGATVFNGQPDPNDASRFWFRYEVEGSSGIIDCWLDDDGLIHFKVRDALSPEVLP